MFYKTTYARSPETFLVVVGYIWLHVEANIECFLQPRFTGILLLREITIIKMVLSKEL